MRRITAGIGIERIFPLHSPLIESVEITRHGSVRRAKLYYLRGLQGRAARIKELNPAQRRRAMEAQAAAEARREEARLAAEAEALEQAAAEAEELAEDEEVAVEAEAEEHGGGIVSVIPIGLISHKPALLPVIPAKAGIHNALSPSDILPSVSLWIPAYRGNDGWRAGMTSRSANDGMMQQVKAVASEVDDLRYADVAVDAPVGHARTFTYGIPARFTVQPGQLVWVPFGSQTLQGIVVELSAAKPDFPTRDILQPVEPAPLLGPGPAPVRPVAQPLLPLAPVRRPLADAAARI